MDFLLADPTAPSETTERAVYESLLSDHWSYLAGEGLIKVQSRYVEAQVVFLFTFLRKT